jgi:4-oxalocrotonate tautomerase
MECPPSFSTEHRTNERSKKMPMIHVEMLEGRSAAQKEELVKVLSEDMARISGVSVDDVWVVINEVSRERWGIGGKLASNILKSD